MARNGEDSARVAEWRPHWHRLFLMDGNGTQSLERAEKPQMQQADGGIACRCEWPGLGDPRFPCVRHDGAMIWPNGFDPDKAHRLLVRWLEP